jgi:tRNA nucleotidyltransferase (CCA-adding enzyme)
MDDGAGGAQRTPLALASPQALGAEVLERLRALPGGPELLELAGGREDVELVGGAVRDLLLGGVPRELDVVLAADAPALAEELAARLGGAVTVHERFGTALVERGEARVDVATRRAESYPSPGALPQVRPGTPEEDLERRDFTVNAIAVGLDRGQRGDLRQAPHALGDLAARRLRVLHERSFSDDPTRLLRLARYRARLGFAIEERTAELAREALAGGALDTVSGARIGAELRLALSEPEPLAALAELSELGVLEALHPLLDWDEPLVRAALVRLPQDGRLDILLLAALILPLIPPDDEYQEAPAREWLDRLEFPHGDRDLAMGAAMGALRLIETVPPCEIPSELYARMCLDSPEGVALSAGLGHEHEDHEVIEGAATFWLQYLRHIELQITGDDLLAAGVPQGPEVGNRLTATLLLRVNEQIGDDRDEQLRVALAIPAKVVADRSAGPLPRRRRRGPHG